MDREQELINLCFSIGLYIGSHKNIQKLSVEEQAEWIADQLRITGFDTQPVGASWGILKDK